jgi:hypothetical protein
LRGERRRRTAAGLTDAQARLNGPKQAEATTKKTEKKEAVKEDTKTATETSKGQANNTVIGIDLGECRPHGLAGLPIGATVFEHLLSTLAL